MRLLVTGGSGFVGSRFLATLAASNPDWSLRCLARDASRIRDGLPPRVTHWECYDHDLTDPIPPGWMDGVDCVLHLAAVTGRADRQAYDIINRQATEHLAKSSLDAGVARFVFVSSVAAGFRDTRYYPYAWSKRAAEDAVRQTSIQNIVLRPTMVFGPQSPVVAGLRALACGPALMLPGGGSHDVQPVSVTDVVRAIGHAIQPSAQPGLYGVGGPERVSMRALLERIRLACRASKGPVLPIPLAPLRSALGAIERILGPRLPVTAGQLASFANPVTVLDLPTLAEPTVGLDAMIAESVPNG